jgi:(hydroxyamino)benzene mutase
MTLTQATDTQRTLIKAGAILFAVGLLTGIWSAFALTHMAHFRMPRLALVAHLNALLGGMWLMVVAYSFHFMNCAEKCQQRIALTFMLSAWANWLVTLGASIVGARGLEYSDDPANNVVAFLLQVLVVLPALAGSLFWVRGLFGKPSSA